MESQMEKMQRLEEFYFKIKRLTRELGRTNFISKDEIEKLLQEYREVRK